MFPTELSLFDIAITAAIVIILASYAMFLFKLKLTKEDESTLNRDFETEEKTAMKPKRSGKRTTLVKTQETIDEEPSPVVENQETPEEPTETIQSRANVEIEEDQKKKKDKETKKSFFLFGKKDFEGCTHKFGHLRSLPKNTPIPDECFGCPQILECLVRSKSK